jgi:hypothetical protein
VRRSVRVFWISLHRKVDRKSIAVITRQSMRCIVLAPAQPLQFFAIADHDQPLRLRRPLKMRRDRRKSRFSENSREALAFLASVEGKFRLFGQMLKWTYRCFDDRSGSENPTKLCVAARRP